MGILIFDDVDVLDFSGPFEVFSRTRLVAGVDSRRTEASAPYEVFTVAVEARPIVASGRLEITPTHTFEDCPPIDILVVPGGFGTRPLLDDERITSWIAATSKAATRTTSVCSGALLLARAGVLHEKRATTHWGALETLGSLDATIEVIDEGRFVDDQVVTSAGISAGIDMAFHIVEQQHGVEVARETARYLDYRGYERRES
ncbi:MAG: DJ-1/PfpI family protein [Myxococcales bacterium]|nr:DJ-1/PfpI family protein [Myxococcales bacterium]MCB9712892.1 DJ-1/PfpI family protein [Myxococcales bacterium]